MLATDGAMGALVAFAVAWDDLVSKAAEVAEVEVDLVRELF